VIHAGKLGLGVVDRGIWLLLFFVGRAGGEPASDGAVLLEGSVDEGEGVADRS
jgi:hypothetical protein